MTGTGLAAASTGLALGLTPTIAIGAQNAFVLRQGLRREHVGLLVAFCASAGALLMAAGAAGAIGVRRGVLALLLLRHAVGGWGWRPARSGR